MNRDDMRALDQADPLAGYRSRFAQLSGSIFLDANSMGPMPIAVPERMADFFTKGWVEQRRRGWNVFPWLDRPHQIGAAIAKHVGAGAEDVISVDNTTLNLFKLLTYALSLRPDRSIILTERVNFPTDLYVAQGLQHALPDKAQVRYLEDRGQITDSITDDVAIVHLSLVDYRSSERWNMREINDLAHAAGALVLWDLSHATGAIPVDLSGTNADLAVGCGYKYLCGGPGGPAYLYVRPDLQNSEWPLIAGWIGHRDYFAFAEDYEPAIGVARHMTGTPSVIANEVAYCAAKIWSEVEPEHVCAKHQSLGDALIALLDSECAEFGVDVTSPREYDKRGGHVAFRVPGGGHVVEALSDRGVIGSFRRPDSIRFGLSALAHSHEDVYHAVMALRDILANETWKNEKFAKVSV